MQGDDAKLAPRFSDAVILFAFTNPQTNERTFYRLNIVSFCRKKN